jgi:hypothetical protein
MEKTGEELFKDKYGIDFNTLTEIEKDKNKTGFYRQNFKILYDKETDRYFSIWSTPYKNYIHIVNQGFITEDFSIKEYYINTKNEIL